ncbi:MAG: DUF4347 domain-containing protein [Nostocaceae cyanobacterium]|nr:DUF4347 domain-containing protein [Nostocaceae cyanobacterium]
MMINCSGLTFKQSSNCASLNFSAGNIKLRESVDSTKILVFIDSGVNNYTYLADGVISEAEFHILEGRKDGIAQITEILKNSNDISQVHIIAHGSPGSLKLGNSILSLDTLGDYSEQLQTWSTETLLLYGCNVAAGDAGEEFLTKLQKITQTTIHASTHKVGNPNQGGNWELNVTIPENSQNSALIPSIPFLANTINSYPHTFALPGARSTTVGGEVFLGGNFIELGLSELGDFGTSAAAPAGFFGTDARSNIGMSVDRDGFDIGVDERVDVFLPGSPVENWTVGYSDSDINFTGTNYNVGGINDIPNSVVNTSSGDTLSATSNGTFEDALQIVQEYSFDVDDTFFRNIVTLTNVSSETLGDVRYMRSFDPDQAIDAGGVFTTINTILNTFEAGDDIAVVEATDVDGENPVFLISRDERARVSNFGFSNFDPYDPLAYDAARLKGFTETSDSAITITFDVGDLAPGESTTFTYFTSLDGTFEEVIEDLNEPPVADDDSYGTEFETPLNIPAVGGVLDGDTDADGDDLTAVLVSDVANGTLTLNPDGSFDYTPDDGFSGTDSFTYRANDGEDDSNIATVLIEVGDAPPEPIFNPVKNRLNPVGGTEGNDGLQGTADADSLEALGGNDVLEGLAGNDVLDGGSGTDTATYERDPAGVSVDLAAGTATDGFGDTDTLISIENIIGSAFVDAITGDSGANSLSGGDGNDIIDGRGGNDIINGGAGADILTGGAGNNTFLYVNPGDGVDTITDFISGVDKIMIVGAVFSPGLNGGSPSADEFFVGSGATDANHRFGYNSATGDVLFDRDGVGGADADVLATLTGTPTFVASDITVV